MSQENAHPGSAFVCDMSGMTPAERKEHMANIQEVFQAVREIRELPDGYAFRLANGADLLRKTAEFIARERLCCPFFGFAVELEPEGGALWLRLTGRDGIKPFIQAEIGEALDEGTSLEFGFQR